MNDRPELTYDRMISFLQQLQQQAHCSALTAWFEAFTSYFPIPFHLLAESDLTQAIQQQQQAMDIMRMLYITPLSASEQALKIQEYSAFCQYVKEQIERGLQFFQSTYSLLLSSTTLSEAHIEQVRALVSQKNATFFLPLLHLYQLFLQLEFALLTFQYLPFSDNSALAERFNQTHQVWSELVRYSSSALFKAAHLPWSDFSVTDYRLHLKQTFTPTQLFEKAYQLTTSSSSFTASSSPSNTTSSTTSQHG